MLVRRRAPTLSTILVEASLDGPVFIKCKSLRLHLLSLGRLTGATPNGGEPRQPGAAYLVHVALILVDIIFAALYLLVDSVDVDERVFPDNLGLSALLLLFCANANRLRHHVVLCKPVALLLLLSVLVLSDEQSFLLMFRLLYQLWVVVVDPCRYFVQVLRH